MDLECTEVSAGEMMGRANAVHPSPTVNSEEEISPYLKQRFVVSDKAAERIKEQKEGKKIGDMLFLSLPGKGHLAFNVHGSFSSGATRELLQLLVEEVKRAGGNFTAAHIANASNWQEVWGNKLEAAERVIVVWDKAYKARFTVNCKWEHDLIYEKATRDDLPICVHFVDDAALEDPEKLRAWLGRIVKDDRPYDNRKGARDHFIPANMDTAMLEEWHAWCTDPSNRVDLDQTARGEALREIEKKIETKNAAAIEAKKSEIESAKAKKYEYDFQRERAVAALENQLKLLEEEPAFLRYNLDTWRQNVAAREGATAAQPEEEDLGLTPTGAVVNANPPLRRIVQNGNVDQVRSALDNGADVNGADTFHMTAAHYAAQNGHHEVLRLLIERGANVVDAANKFGRTPIFLAAGMSNMRCVQILKAAGAKGEDVVSTPDLESALRDAAKEGDVDTVQTMIDNGVVDLNAGAPTDGETALMVAAREGKVECVKALVKGGADVNVADNARWTVLMWAAQEGSSECVDLLIKAGADLNLKDTQFGGTALMGAARKGSPECVDLLIKAGADLNLKDTLGMTALMWAAEKGSAECVDLLIKAGADLNLKDNIGGTALMKAAAEKGSPECVDLLIKAGADVNLKDNREGTALMYAAKKGSPECVDLLIKAGADLNLKAPLYGETALMKAAEKGSPECVDLLIKAGADLNLKNNRGWTALMKAAVKGSPECVDLLIKAGADLNLKDRDGETALMKAAKEGSPECVDLLIKAGADLNLEDTLCGETALMKAAKEGSPECVDLLIKAGADLNLKNVWGARALGLAKTVEESDDEEKKAGKAKCAALLKAAGAKEVDAQRACCAIQ